jgi:hypothetical protein
VGALRLAHMTLRFAVRAIPIAVRPAHEGSWVPVLAIVFVLAWSFAAASWSGQWGDHFEQFVWAHGVEWGYHKHPPLPTWMLAGTIAAFGPWSGWAVVLASLCSLGTGFFTYRIARELLGHPAAVLALIFWGLQQPFSSRAHLFNHNTVMMLMVSATAWCLLKTLKSPTLLRWWAATGVLAGLAMLAKYQAAIPLAGLVVAAWLSGELRSRPCRVGLSITALLAVSVFAPHVAWVLEHDLTTLAYAAQEGRSSSALERAWNVATFLAQQLRLLLPALLFAGLLVVLPRTASGGPTDEPGPDAKRRRAWLLGLVGFPLFVTVLTGPVLGVALQNHWGYQALQFASLWLSWRMGRKGLPAHPGWLALPILLHAVFIGLAFSPSMMDRGSRKDASYPAQKLADAVRHDWQDDTSCPLSYVVGPTFEAGIVSVYNGGTAAVLEDGAYLKSPWIDRTRLRQMGAVHLAASPSDLPSHGVTRTGYLDVRSASPAPRDRVYWAIVPPETCLQDGRVSTGQ